MGYEDCEHYRKKYILLQKLQFSYITIFASQVSDSLALTVDESERIGHLAREDDTLLAWSHKESICI